MFSMSLRGSPEGTTKQSKIFSMNTIFGNFRLLRRAKALLAMTFFFLLVQYTSCSAQVKYDFPQFWKEIGQFFSLPAHWDAMDWGTLILLAGIAADASGIEVPERDIKFITRDLYYSPMAVGGRMYGELYTPFVLFGA